MRQRKNISLAANIFTHTFQFSHTKHSIIRALKTKAFRSHNIIIHVLLLARYIKLHSSVLSNFSSLLYEVLLTMTFLDNDCFILTQFVFQKPRRQTRSVRLIIPLDSAWNLVSCFLPIRLWEIQTKIPRLPVQLQGVSVIPGTPLRESSLCEDERCYQTIIHLLIIKET